MFRLQSSLPQPSSFAWFALLASAMCAHATPITVQNGSFESTTLAQSSEFGANYSSQQVTGWTGLGYSWVYMPGTADTTGGPGESGNVKLWGPGDGSANGLTISPVGGNFIAMDGAYKDGSISQVLYGLTPGAITTVSFYYAGAQQYSYNGATTEAFRVSLGSQVITTPYLANSNHGFTGWQLETLQFTATSTSETLKFLAQGTPTGEPPFTLLDGITVFDNTTPEPSSLALMGTGLITVGGMVRRKYVSTRK